MAGQLFTTDARTRWQGGRYLVPYTGDQRCIRCGMTRLHVTYDQPALLRHGGYGATDRITVRACFCGTTRDLETINPRLLA